MQGSNFKIGSRRKCSSSPFLKKKVKMNKIQMKNKIEMQT